MVVWWGLDNLSSVTCYCLTVSQNLVAKKTTRFIISHQLRGLVQWFFCKSHLGSAFRQHIGWGLSGTAESPCGSLSWAYSTIVSEYHEGSSVKAYAQELTEHCFCDILLVRASHSLAQIQSMRKWILHLDGESCKIWPHFKSTIIMYPEHSCNKYWLTSTF